MRSRREFLLTVAHAGALCSFASLSRAERFPAVESATPRIQKVERTMSMRGVVEKRSLMLERQLAADEATVRVDLTHADDALASFVVFARAGEPLALKPGAVHELYLLCGELVEGSRRTHPYGSFLCRSSDAQLVAGARGATLFVHRGSGVGRAAESTVHAADLRWYQGGAEGMQVAPLRSQEHRLMLVSWRPGTRVGFHDHPQGEEIFVIRGELRDQRGSYPAGSWQRLHPDTGHQPYADIDTLILLRNGHLRA